MQENSYISRKGLDKLRADLDALKKKRPLISKAIEEAREKGDLKENAEYHAAKEEMAHTQRRIGELENKIARARVLEDQDIPSDKAYIGATVEVADETGTTSAYTLADTAEADPSKGIISVASPIGQALLGQAVNARVNVTVGKNSFSLTIKRISRE